MAPVTSTLAAAAYLGGVPVPGGRLVSWVSSVGGGGVVAVIHPFGGLLPIDAPH
jgi:hypothetical protein